MNPKIDAFLSSAQKWQKEMKKLRSILLDCGLTEELKWGLPCYSFENKNIVIIQGFKDYCALLFFKGFLLNDPEGILIRTGPNTKVGRQVRFTDARQITKLEKVLKAYVYQAIEVERAGLKVPVDKNEKLVLPEEFKSKLNELPALKIAFKALTPGRQRAYAFFFSQPKQSKTRASRIDKYVRQILDGRGLND